MDTGNFIKIAIGTAILMIVVIMVVTPILNGVTYTETENNEPSGYATAARPGVLHWSDAGGFYVDDGAVITIDNNDWVLLSDTLLVIKSYGELRIVDYATETAISTRTMTINADGTWTAANSDATGSIGDNAIMRTDTASNIGAYRSTSFMINKEDSAHFFRFAYGVVTIEGTQYVARGIVSGTIDNLTVTGLVLVADATNIFLDGATAEILPESITEINVKTFGVAANPLIKISFNYDGTDYSFSNGPATTIAAPVTYTVEKHDAIESMMGIVPVIMLAGIITLLIGTLMIRRS